MGTMSRPPRLAIAAAVALAPFAITTGCATPPPPPATAPAVAVHEAPSAAPSAAPTSAHRPTAGYAERVRQAIRPNIVLREPIEGSPVAEVEVRVAADGSILNVTLVRGSGVAVWDQTVQNAVWRTVRLPLDSDGRVPPVMRLVFRPRPGP
jgi:colicin import membrane protein